MGTFAERIEGLGNEHFLDSIIVSHGFTPYGRDYDVTLLTVAALPPDVPIGETTGTYVDCRYRYRFTHVPETHLRSAVEPVWWNESWDDVLSSSWPLTNCFWAFAGGDVQTPEGSWTAATSKSGIHPQRPPTFRIITSPR